MIYAVVDPKTGQVRNVIVAAERIDVGRMKLVADPDGLARIGGSWVDDVGFVSPPEPQEPVPDRITRTQGLIALYLSARITEAMIAGAIGEIESEVDREIARLRFYAADWHRSSPFIAWGGQRFGLGQQEIDNLFRQAATL